MYPLKLTPTIKDYIWGGTRLRDRFGLQSDLDRLAEAWVLSCHKDGASVVQNGQLAGLTLAEAVEKLGKDCLGTKGQAFAFFPMLIKLIDAKSNLSIQVHPSDEYALEVEKEYGKTEMWYVVDADEGAYLYYGFQKEISKEEFARRIAEDTITDVLNKVEVKKGDCFFIEAGTIHAIGAGLLIAEIQQNSNTTYRVYDYGRVGADGKPRELHVEKAKAVTDLCPPAHPVKNVQSGMLARCDYFTVEKHDLDGTLTLQVGTDSFSSLLCVSGTASVNGVDCKAGECIFLPAGLGAIEVTGKAELIESRV